ncbi:LysR substrate-binding domain-containing protein, partial [Sinorhizobium meliloti]|uniref:LysR substrate-binding domain-containing protein n=1 Tax=Rhizobium meliloti TaxID=382 RepID=UPI001F2A2C80
AKVYLKPPGLARTKSAFYAIIPNTCCLWMGTSYGGFYAWEFERDGHEVRVRVDGQVAFNGVPQIVKAALDGFGLTYVHEDVVREYLKNGRLVQVLDDWTPPFPGYHLYYPSRRHPSPAFTLLVEALKE